MHDEWTKLVPGDRLVKFTFEDLADGGAFLTAQIAGHEVVYSVVLDKTREPFSRASVERHFDREFRPMSH
jgi:hypothetical protein